MAVVKGKARFFRGLCAACLMVGLGFLLPCVHLAR